MDKIKFSVLLSVYKNEKSKHLIECFKSIYDNQELKPSEIVLVQDGPLTDELYQVIKNLKNQLKSILKIIPIEKNVRLGNALKIGIENCSNELIARMDTDDIAHPNRFKKQIEYLKKNPTIDVLGSYMNEFIGDITNVVAIKTAPLKDFKNYMKLRDPVNHPSVIFKKSKVIKAGNYIEILYNEDSYLWGRMLANNCQFANIDESLVYFRISNDTYKRRGGFQYIKAEIQLQKKFLKLRIINKSEFIRNIILKNIIRIMPNELRKSFYLKLLREKNKGVLVKKILILSGINWSDTIQRHQRISEFLSNNKCNVIFIESIVSSKFSLKKIIQKMLTASTKKKKIFTQQTKVKVIKTFFLNPHGIFKYYNHIKIRKLLQNIGNEFDVIINYLPIDTTNYLIDRSKYDLLIYDCVRDFENWDGYHKNIKKYEAILLSKSNYILVDSFYLKEKLFNKLNNSNKIIQIFPTISKEEVLIYNKYYERELRPIENISYFGSIDKHIDIKILNKLSKKYNINIIGKIDQQVKFSKNVKIYEFTNNLSELAELLLRISDAIVIPYYGNMDGVIPAKLIQALSTGLPVYINSFYDSRILKDKLYIFENYENLDDLILKFDKKEFYNRKIQYKEFIQESIEEKQFQKILEKINIEERKK